MLKIHLNEIPEEGLRFSVNDAAWFPELEVTRRGNPEAFLLLKRSGERVLVNGSIKVALVFLCDRCLEEFVRLQEINFQLVLEVAGPESVLSEQQDTEYEYDPGQIEVVYCDGQFVDLGDLLCQQMILAVPLKSLCRDDCCGICEHCGADRNLRKCGCADALESSPFASLNQLLKKQ